MIIIVSLYITIIKYFYYRTGETTQIWVKQWQFIWYSLVTFFWYVGLEPSWHNT